MRLILLTAALTVLHTVALATGTQSHSHMRQSHKHMKGEEGQKHRHHLPKRDTGTPSTDSDSDSLQRDPKRPPPPSPPPVLKNPKLLQDSKMVHDTDHIKEELPNYISAEKIKNMSPRELDYHYFKIHDFDDNRKLDGLELMKALGHVHGHDDDDDEDDEEKYKMLSEMEKKTLKHLQRQKQEEDWKFYIELIDEVLDDNDRNKDGYLNYGEYVNGRNRNYGQQEYLDSLE